MLADETINAKGRALMLAGVIETLKSQHRNQVSVGGAIFQQTTEPIPEIREILDHLAATSPPAP
jgi:hypothetical protein